MIGIQIVSHGTLSEGALDSLDMILGDTSNVVANVLSRSSDLESFKDVVFETTQSIFGDGGVLVFVDMFGATPYNAAMYNSQYFDKEKYVVISGFNIPILIEAVVNREQMTVRELAEYLDELASDSIVIEV